MTLDCITAHRAHPRTFGRDTSGATSVEFALVSSALILLLFGVVEFGIVAYRRNLAAEGARFGARFAMVRGSDSGRAPTTGDFQDTVRTRMAEQGVNVALTYPDAGNKGPGKRVQVTVSYPGTLRITRLFPGFTVSASAESVIVY